MASVPTFMYRVRTARLFMYHPEMRQRSPSVVLVLLTIASIGLLSRCAVTQPTTESATTEYVNLPLSNAELRANIRHANLILHGKIVAYKPPTFGDHIATMEETTVLIETIYAGTNKPGETLTYECVCHQVEPPLPADRVGHEVLLFLAYDKRTHVWSPATKQAELYFHPELELRLKKILQRNP